MDLMKNGAKKSGFTIKKIIVFRELSLYIILTYILLSFQNIVNVIEYDILSVERSFACHEFRMFSFLNCCIIFQFLNKID